MRVCVQSKAVMTLPATFVIDTPADAQRAAELRRVKLLATLVLAATFAIFIAARMLVPIHPAFGFVAAFAEAATIGGLADWYAVVALFRRPLGLPIPHTAIIQSNQHRIADKLASAKSLSEAAQIQSDMVRARGEVFVSRAKATTEYLGKLVADSAKTAQDNFSKVYSKTA